MNNILCCIFVMVLLHSCNYPTGYNITENEPKIAATSFFTPGIPLLVKVEPLKNAFNDKHDNEFSIVKDVRVLHINSGSYYQLSYVGDDSLLYSSNSLIPEHGDIFKLEIEIENNGVVVESVDSIVMNVVKFDIVDTGYKIEDEKTIFFDRTALIRIDKNTLTIGCRYEIIVSAQILNDTLPFSKEMIQQNIETTAPFITSEYYYPSATGFDFYLPESLLFTYNERGNDLLVDFEYNPGIGSGAGLGVHIPKHILQIEVRGVSEAYYKYKTAIYKQRNAIRGDEVYGPATPVIIPSNIKNATGVFAAYTSTIESIVVDDMFIK